MGALADRCPQCGAFLKKGAQSCQRCGWEPEVFLTPGPTAQELRRAFRRGIAVGLGVGLGSVGLLALVIWILRLLAAGGR